MKALPKNVRWKTPAALLLVSAGILLLGNCLTAQTVVIDEVVSTDSTEVASSSAAKQTEQSTVGGMYIGVGGVFGPTAGNVTEDHGIFGAFNVGIITRTRLFKPLYIVSNVGFSSQSHRIRWRDDQPHAFTDSMHYMQQHFNLGMIEMGGGFHVQLMRNKKDPNRWGTYLEGGIRGFFTVAPMLITRDFDNTQNQRVVLNRQMANTLNSRWGAKLYAAIGWHSLTLEAEYFFLDTFKPGALAHDISLSPYTVRLVLRGLFADD